MPMRISINEEAGLSRRQVEEFEENGYLVIDGVLNGGEVERLRAVCAKPAIMDRLNRSGHAESAVHMLELTTMDPAFMELAKHPRILDKIAPLLGPDIQLHQSKLATKPPSKGKGRIGWHQDFSYFPHTNTSVLAVMVMLDDATPENGCMQMVRGSHKGGPLDISMKDFHSDEEKDKNLWSDPSKIVSITPKTGGISIHHCLVLHGSPPNLSGKPRRGIVFEYRSDDAYQIAGGVFKDTGILVRGERGGKVRCDIGVLAVPEEVKQISPEFYPRNAWHQEGELAGCQRAV